MYQPVSRQAAVLYLCKESGPSWLNVSETGTITGTRPSTAADETTAVIRVADQEGASASITIIVEEVRKHVRITTIHEDSINESNYDMEFIDGTTEKQLTKKTRLTSFYLATGDKSTDANGDYYPLGTEVVSSAQPGDSLYYYFCVLVQVMVQETIKHCTIWIKTIFLSK